MRRKDSKGALRLRQKGGVGIGMLLRTAEMAFNRALREALKAHDVTFSQFQHLRQLWLTDGLAQVELSKRIGIETASSTSVLDQLEHGGLITRRRDTADRRRIIVNLTPRGRGMERPLTACAQRVNARARNGLSGQECADLFRLVQAVTNNMSHDSRLAAGGVRREERRSSMVALP